MFRDQGPIWFSTSTSHPVCSLSYSWLEQKSLPASLVIHNLFQPTAQQPSTTQFRFQLWTSQWRWQLFLTSSWTCLDCLSWMGFNWALSWQHYLGQTQKRGNISDFVWDKTWTRSSLEGVPELSPKSRLHTLWWREMLQSSPLTGSRLLPTLILIQSSEALFLSLSLDVDYQHLYYKYCQ